MEQKVVRNKWNELGSVEQQVDALIRHESGKHLVPSLPLYACVAETQGFLGFMIQSSLSRHLDSGDIVSLISIAYVSKNDPAFKKPSKPVGPVYVEDVLEEVRELNPDRCRRAYLGYTGDRKLLRNVC